MKNIESSYRLYRAEEQEISDRIAKIAALAVFFAAVTVIFFGARIERLFASTAAVIGTPFSYNFNSSGTLDQVSNQDQSSSAYWWLPGGGRLILSNGVGASISGSLPTGDKWYKYYAANNPTATDNGTHPQNVLQLFLRDQATNPSAQIYFKKTADNLSNAKNIQAYNGQSLLVRYADVNNYYYAGLRADGGVVIKKKVNGVYQTLGYKKIIPGTYSAVSSPNLIPKGEWIGLKTVVESDASGDPEISLYTDIGKTGTWTLVLQAVDDPAKFGAGLTRAGLVGIESDFSDVQFDDFLLSDASAAVPAPLPAPAPVPTPTALLSDPFSQYPDGLITNEFAYWNPTDSSAKVSPTWELDSGSLFAQSGAGWTGVPDTGAPNALSSNANNSAVFRLTTKEADFGDVAVNFDLLNQGLSTTASTPAVAWDGLHIFLRYQSEYNLYYASINRRDNTVVIKKKIPGGPSNDGTYYELVSYKPHTVPYGAWQHIKATVKNNADGSVTINLYADGTLVTTATDNGTIGGAPITHAGKVGLRGDNANLKFKNFTVTAF
jgi:hypothetical protein